jgi:SAM-dependent methyltransferase
MAYIREYTALNAKEQRQLAFKRRYKQEYPEWDDSMVLLTNEIRKRLPSQARVLDYGCGHGNFVLDELRGGLGERVGFDIDEASATRNTSVERLIIGSEALSREPSASFDLVVSLWALEHFAEPEACSLL